MRHSTDWPPHRVVYELRERGWSFKRIAEAYGYSCPHTPSDVQRKPYPVMEAIVAGIIGVAPQEIWPSRYDEHGRPLGPRAARRDNPLDGRWSAKRR